MNYPLWEVPVIGGGWVIGITAIFHVMISQFAVGGGLYLALAEYKALKEGRRDWLEVLKTHTRFFLILTAVFGTVSGVGIWFAISLAHPEGTSALIHNFVFGWAIEWVVFLVELLTVMVYYYSWGRISDKLHLQVGWAYAIASFFTLFIINGILTFKLSPAHAWLAATATGQESSQFWAAFFNPGFWPSLFIRMGICGALAGTWALLTCGQMSADKPELKSEVTRWTAQWLLPLFITLPFLLFWYVSQVPEAQRVLLNLGVSTMAPGLFTLVTRMIILLMITSVAIVGVLYLLVFREPVEFNRKQAIIIVALVWCFIGTVEYTRELLRKPFLVVGYMYSNGVRVADIPGYNKNGYLAQTNWISASGDRSLAKGQAMFRGQCMSCHTISGYRPMKTLLAGRDREAIGSLLKILQANGADSPYHSFMPPLVGTEDEVKALGDFLDTLSFKSQAAGH